MIIFISSTLVPWYPGTREKYHRVFELRVVWNHKMKQIFEKSDLSADKFDLLWIDLLQTCLKHIFSIMRQLDF